MLYANGMSAIVIALLLFLLMLAAHWAGMQVRLVRRRQQPGETITGSSTIEGSLLGLLALITTDAMQQKMVDLRAMFQEK